MRVAVIALLLVALQVEAADPGTLQRQIERGSTAERTSALRELAKQDPGGAVSRSLAWIVPGTEPALRRAAARTLWDLGDQARAAEPALRTCKDDPDEDVAYACVGALSTMGVPKAELRSARLRLARSGDGFIAFYASRALFPDPELPLAEALSATFAAVNIVASGRPSDMKTRDALRSNARTFAFELAKTSGRQGFDALMTAYPTASPPARELIADALNHVPAQHGDPLQIATLLDSPQLPVRRAALNALIDYHDRAAPVVDRMMAALGPANEPDLRKSAASALGATGAAPALASEQALRSPWRSDVEARIGPALARVATSDPERDVRKEAADALQKLRLWAGPALGAVGDRIPVEPDPVVRHALVRACWTARESPQLPRAALAAIAEGDPVDYVRNEAKVTLQAARP